MSAALLTLIAVIAPTDAAVAQSMVMTPDTQLGGTVGVRYAGFGYMTKTPGGSTVPGSAYSVTAGSLPPGLFLGANVVQGTPTEVGSFTFTMTGTNGGDSASRQYTLTMAAPTVVLAAATLGQASEGAAYSETLPAATGGTAPYGYALTGGALPTGLTLGAGGGITGTPTTAGTYNFTVRATDSTTGTGASYGASRAYSITVTQLAPTAVAESYDADEDQTLTIAAPGVLANDTDPENDSLTAVLVGNAAHGMVTLDANGGFSYVPVADYSGADSFAYVAHDGLAESAPVTVSLNVRPDTDAAQRIGDFLAARAHLILANLPDGQRRLDRVDGVATASGISGADVMAYLPEVAAGAVPDLAMSLAGIDAATGNAEMSPFDAWIEGTFALYHGGNDGGQFGVASLGADYLVSPGLLIGGFLQLDLMGETSISGTGWLAGPYVTAKLGEGLYLDILAGAGRSSNSISPIAGVTDTFDATRWLLSATLSGAITFDQLTISPSARLSYFEETSAAYVDGFGMAVPSVTAGLGQVALGSGFAYRLVDDRNVTVDTTLRLEAIGDIDRTLGVQDVSGRVEGGVSFGFVGGAKLGLSASYDGLGTSDLKAIGGSVKLGAPIR